jgi:predicted DNA-binding transcriptional regulator YafY
VRRTVYRDLDALLLAGFPLVSERRDGRVYHRFVDGFRLGGAPFTPDEILALAFGEDLLRILEGTVFHDSIRSALAKIRAGLSPQLAAYLERLRESFRVLPGPHKSYSRFRDTIRCLNEAVLGRRGVRMRYRTGRTGAVSSRDLDPYRVWYRSGALYVIGHDHQSGELRTFAVDRIEAIELAARRFEVPESFDFDATVGRAFGVVHEPGAVAVRVRFEKPWARLVSERSWHPSQRLEPLADGRLLLCLEVAATSEVVSWLLSFGAGVEVLEPASLRREVREELARALARYADAPARSSRRGSPRAACRAPRSGRASAR